VLDRGILTLAIAYLLGSIPFAYLITHFNKRVDIRKIGTGNAGSMNVAREVGFLSGALVFILDVGKGCLAIFAGRWLGVSTFWLFVAGFAAIAGHSWSPFLRFSGGRGVATGLGILLAFAPLEFGIGFVVILGIFFFTRNSGLASGIGLLILPLILWIFDEELLVVLYPVFIGVFLGLRSLLALKPNELRSYTKKSAMFRKYPAFWRRRKT